MSAGGTPPAAPQRHDGAGTLARGVLAGAAAWWAMDQVLQVIRDRHHPSVRRSEDAARGGVPALEVLAARLAVLGGHPLSAAERARAGTWMQWILGIGGGVLYASLRDRLWSAGIPRGLGYGAAFALVVDEGLVPLLGLAPGPAAFPWQTHARGFLGHLVYGVTAETVLAAMEGR